MSERLNIGEKLKAGAIAGVAVLAMSGCAREYNGGQKIMLR